MSLDTTIKTDEAKVKSAVQADVTKAESYLKTEESATFSGKVLGIAVVAALIIGFVVAKVL